MNVLVDTCIWSLALRRRHDPLQDWERDAVAELQQLCEESRALIIGPVRQELLSGVRSEQQFVTLRDRLRAFPDLPLETTTFELAATCFNTCRGRGIQGSNTDFILCAVAIESKLAIFTVDADFTLFAEALGIRLHQGSESGQPKIV